MKIRFRENVCPFLDNLDVKFTSCQIYPHRPSICCCFPFTYSILAKNQLILILPAINSDGKTTCQGFIQTNDQLSDKNAYKLIFEIIDDIIKDIKVSFEITNLKTQLKTI